MARKHGKKIDFDRIQLRRQRRITGGVVSHEHPAWSPDGRHLCFYAGVYGSIDIVLTDRRGRFASVIADGPGNKTQAAWHPDGKKIAYRWQSANDKPWEIWEVDVLGGPSTAKRLLGDGKNSYKHPTYSPDGRWIAYFSDEGTPRNFHLFLLDTVSATRRQLTFDPHRNDCHPSWSTDGLEIAFHAYEGVEDATESNIYTLTVESGQVEKVSPGASLDKHAFFIDDRFLVWHREDAAGERGIVLHDRVTKREKVLTDLDENCKHPHPFVGKDRHVRLAFATKQRGDELEGEDKRYDIVTARIDGLRVAKSKKKSRRSPEEVARGDADETQPPVAAPAQETNGSKGGAGAGAGAGPGTPELTA
jgi:WD40-like Beta Propeller Repeat